MSGWKLLDPSSYKYIVSNTKAVVRWGCLYTVEANTVSYWSCSNSGEPFTGIFVLSYQKNNPS